MVVEAVLVFTIVKFRRRPGREAAQFHGNTKVEVVLTLIPTLILFGLGVFVGVRAGAPSTVPSNVSSDRKTSR